MQSFRARQPAEGRGNSDASRPDNGRVQLRPDAVTCWQSAAVGRLGDAGSVMDPVEVLEWVWWIVLSVERVVRRVTWLSYYRDPSRADSLLCLCTRPFLVQPTHPSPNPQLGYCYFYRMGELLYSGSAGGGDGERHQPADGKATGEENGDSCRGCRKNSSKTVP